MSVKGVRVANGEQNTFDAIFPGTSQKVAFSSVSSQSAALGSSTTLVRVMASQNCYLAFGANPTATTSTSLFLPTGVIEKFGVTSATKIAVIRDSADGNLYITEATAT